MTIERANDLLDRIEKLDDGTSQLLAHNFMLKNFQDRLPLHFAEQQLGVVTNVRSAILRATIALALAILDSPGTDRAGFGQIILLMNDRPFREFLFETLRRSQNATPNEEAFQILLALYDQIRASDGFARVRHLRNSEIGHLLVLGNRSAPYPLIFQLAENIQQSVALLFNALGTRSPYFVGQIDDMQRQATLFWDTYLGAPNVLLANGD